MKVGLRPLGREELDTGICTHRTDPTCAHSEGTRLCPRPAVVSLMAPALALPCSGSEGH